MQVKKLDALTYDHLTHLFFFYKFLLFHWLLLHAYGKSRILSWSHQLMWNRVMIYWLYKAGDFLWYVPMKTNGTTVTFQTAYFCHFLCNMDSISKWRQKPLFCWVTLQSNRQLQKSWYTLFLVPVLTLKFCPVLASLFFLSFFNARVAIWFSMHVPAHIFSDLLLQFSLSVAAILLTVTSLQVLSTSHKAALWKREVEDNDQLSWVQSISSPKVMSNNKLLFLRCLIHCLIALKCSWQLNETYLRDAGLQPVGCYGNNRIWSMKKAV